MFDNRVEVSDSDLEQGAIAVFGRQADSLHSLSINRPKASNYHSTTGRRLTEELRRKRIEHGQVIEQTVKHNAKYIIFADETEYKLMFDEDNGVSRCITSDGKRFEREEKITAMQTSKNKFKQKILNNLEESE